MKRRKIFKRAFWLLSMPSAFAGLMLALKEIKGEGVETFSFWIYLFIGMWIVISVIFFVTEFLVNNDFWEDHDRLIKKRQELQDEIDGFIRARQRYIKEWEKVNNIWSKFENKEK